MMKELQGNPQRYHQRQVLNVALILGILIQFSFLVIAIQRAESWHAVLWVVLASNLITVFCLYTSFVKKNYNKAAFFYSLLGAPIPGALLALSKGLPMGVLFWGGSTLASCFFLLKGRALNITLTVFGVTQLLGLYISEFNLIPDKYRFVGGQYVTYSYFATLIFLLVLIFLYVRSIRILRNLEIKQTLIKKNLTATLCNDIASPIEQIIASSGEVSQTGRKVSDSMKYIASSASRIASIIDTIRKVDALERGKTELSLEELDLGDILKKSQAIFDKKLSEKQIKLEFLSDFGGLKVLGDEGILLNNVINGLISNSIKFSQAGNNIKISSEVKKDFLEVLIEDGGIGIPEELMSGIFKLDATSLRPGLDGEKGTGYGMSLAKSSLEKMGGKIWVRSRSIEDSPENHGTQYILSFPNRQVSPSLGYSNIHNEL